MPWLQLHLEVPAADSESFEDLLLESGACAVTLRDAGDHPLYEPPAGSTPLWDHVVLTALFAAGTDLAAICTAIEKRIAPRPMPACRREILEDRAWEREWLRDFKPMQFGHRLWICPRDIEPPAEAEIILPLDPGLAFGTGTHATTRLCLEWLDSQDLAGKSVLDFGCGSGVLGLAALLLRADSLLAIDNDPQAVTATSDNAHRIRLDPAHYRVRLADQNDPQQQRTFDVVLANILADILIELAPQIIGRVRPGGALVLSGILSAQAEPVLDRYRDWLDDPVVAELDGWVRISGIRAEAS